MSIVFNKTEKTMIYITDLKDAKSVSFMTINPASFQAKVTEFYYLFKDRQMMEKSQLSAYF